MMTKSKFITRNKSRLNLHSTNEKQWQLDRPAAIQWARSILDSKETVLLLDTETSDLSGEVIELAIADDLRTEWFKVATAESEEVE